MLRREALLTPKEREKPLRRVLLFPKGCYSRFTVGSRLVLPAFCSGFKPPFQPFLLLW